MGLDRFVSIFFSLALTLSEFLEQQNPQQNMLKHFDYSFLLSPVSGVAISSFIGGAKSYSLPILFGLNLDSLFP
jgi:hypothetical protein